MPVFFHFLVIIWFLLLTAGILVLFYAVRKKTAWSKKLILLVFLFGLILLSRMIVNLYGVDAAQTETDPLAYMNPLERFLDSIVHALQSFSMDEDYTGYIAKGKQLFATAYSPVCGTIYGFLISVMDILAPVTGGAVLLDILTGIFPRFKLGIHPYSHKIVFSELNEQSITLAEDVYQNYEKLFPDSDKKNKAVRRPLIIFTDVYSDHDTEEISEINERAGRINAVCIKADLEKLSLKKSKSVHYILIDNNEQSNMNALMGLLESTILPNEKKVCSIGEKCRSFITALLKKLERPVSSDDKKDEDNDAKSEFIRTQIFIICHSEENRELVDNICKKKDLQGRILVRTINDYAHAAVMLAAERPLFIPLLESTETMTVQHPEEGTDAFGAFRTQHDAEGRIGGIIPERKLNVTILGSGNIAEEVFKTVFWCGQMSGIQLVLNILSQDTKQMIERLKSSCPELFRTCIERKNGILKDNNTPDPLLRIYPASELMNPPYAVINWWDNINAENIREYPDGILEETHYYIAVLGEDTKNSAVTLMLKRTLAGLMLDHKIPFRPVITTAIYDDRLADSLIAADKTKACEPYVFPFATLKKRYSCNNIFFSNFYADAKEAAVLYSEKEQKKYFEDSYNYWSNIAKVVHAPYKLYGLGRVRKNSEPALSRYTFDIVKGKLNEPDRAAFRWMEKRRWNAYIRSRGFVGLTVTQHNALYAAKQLHKDVDSRLHNCLVEAGLNKPMEPKTYPVCFDFFDALDMVSVRVYEMVTSEKQRTAEGLISTDYRKYDDIKYDPSSEKLIQLTDDNEKKQK